MDGSPDLICLNWKSHDLTILEGIKHLREKDQFSDVTLACGGKFFTAHKILLSLCSEYLDSLLKKTTCSHPVIVLLGIQPNYLQLLLLYIYNGRVDLEKDHLQGFIKAAELLVIKGLVREQKLDGEICSSSSSCEKSNTSSAKESDAGREERRECDKVEELPMDDENDSHSDREKELNRNEDTFNPIIQNTESIIVKEDITNEEISSKCLKNSKKGKFVIYKKNNMFCCSICPKRSLSKQIIVNHEHIQVLYCSFCSYSTWYVRSLRAHVKLHKESITSHKCSICSFVGARKNSITEHEFVSHNIIPKKNSEFSQKCFAENFHESSKSGANVSSKSSSVAETSKDNHNVETYKCSSCEFTTKMRSTFVEHEEKHTEETPYEKSDDDGTTFKNNPANTGTKLNLYMCPLCKISFKSTSLLMMHRKRHHIPENLYKCQYCPYKTKFQFNLTRHGKSHVNEIKDRKVNVGSTILKCYECSFLCTNKKVLAKHKERHAHLRKFAQDKLPTVNSVNSSHGREPQNPKSDKDIPTVMLNSKVTLTSDLKSISESCQSEVDNKLHKCSSCSFTAKVRVTVIEHERRHSGETPYHCFFCPFKTAFRSSLHLHKNRHVEYQMMKTGNKKMFLKNKNINFSNKSTNNGRNKTRESFQCHFCSYKVFCRAPYNAHMKVHNEKSEFSCYMCRYETEDQNSLNLHFKTNEHLRREKSIHAGHYFYQKLPLSGNIKVEKRFIDARIKSKASGKVKLYPVVKIKSLDLGEICDANNLLSPNVKKSFKDFSGNASSLERNQSSSANKNLGEKSPASNLTNCKGNIVPRLNVKLSTKARKIGRRRFRCKSCAGCLRSDCLKCSCCKDMAKYGGPSLWNKSCQLRKCAQMPFRPRPKNARENFNCGICPFTSHNQILFDKHVAMHCNERTMLVCEECGFNTADGDELKNHLLQHELDKCYRSNTFSYQRSVANLNQ